MATVRELLEKTAHDLEPQVRSQLGGFFGGMVRAYLPQTWEFRTEHGTASLTVDRAGSVTVADGPVPSPDVTVETTYDRLVAALTSRSRTNVPPGTIKVTAHSAKGKTAFDYLRGRLGL